MAVDDALARYLEERLDELSRWYSRDSRWIKSNEFFSPEEKEARMADLWVRVTDRRDEVRRLQKHFRERPSLAPLRERARASTATDHLAAL